MPDQYQFPRIPPGYPGMDFEGNHQVTVPFAAWHQAANDDVKPWTPGPRTA